MKRGYWRYTLLIWGVFILMTAVFSKFPLVTEHVYFEKVYQWIRWIYDHTLGRLPIPMIYVFFLLIVIFIGRMIGKIRKEFTSHQGLTKWMQPVLILVNGIGILLLFFYLSWGYNYYRPAFPDRYHLPDVEADSLVIFEEINTITRLINEKRANISMDTIALNDSVLSGNIEREIRSSLESIIDGFGSPYLGEGRVRIMKPSGTLLRISTAGFYLPYAFEGQIDNGLHAVQKPFVLAHEMGHVYGYAEEGTCNFLGFLACMNTDDDFIQYSGLIGYWRYLASNLRRSSPRLYIKARNNINVAVNNDLKAISIQMDKFPDILPELRDKVYHTYLRTNGIKDGIDNYSVIVQLMQRWKSSDYHRALYDQLYDSAKGK